MKLFVDHSLNLDRFLGQIHHQTSFFPNALRERITHNEIESMFFNFNTIIFDNDPSLALNLKILFLQLNDKFS